MSEDNLLGIPPTRLPDDADVRAAIDETAGDVDLLRAVVETHPASSLAWATLADAVFDPNRALESYAYARVGYHRGLDSLRKSGWRGQGPVPWEHQPNRGVLRAFFALRRAAEAIGEEPEVARLDGLLRDADAGALDELRTVAGAWVPCHAQAPTTEAIVVRGID